MNTLSAAEVQRMVCDGEEIALVDVREELLFSQGHLLHARSVPLSQLEIRIEALVPRRNVRLVLCDGDDGLAERAAKILQAGGYSNLFLLNDGVAAWLEAGFELFSGVNVPSKGFGEFIEHECGTPSISAEELSQLLARRADLVVLDSRPFEEYQGMSIPTAVNVPGAELVLRARDLAPSPDTMIVVNCAGRTRSLIGTQSLLNAGVPNKVVALRNGTMGWSLAGLECESGQSRRSSEPSPACIAWAKDACVRVAESFKVQRIDPETLEQWKQDSSRRTLYVLDVRDPSEYRVGHLSGAVSAPGGQLVQATDQFLGVLGSRIVLVDEMEVRAVMTASWLMQMGWKDVYVLAEKGSEVGVPPQKTLGTHPSRDAAIDPADLRRLLDDGGVTVLDLSRSPNYRKGHIAGAAFAIRSRLERALSNLEIAGRTLVLTSEDGCVAGLAVPEAQALSSPSVRYLDGGNAAWSSAGFELESGEGRFADEPIDAWLKPYERSADVRSAMTEYLSWEVDLLDKIRREGTCNFRIAGRFGAS